MLANEQEGNRKGTKGTRDHQLMDKTAIRGSKEGKTNLSMCWIDYKKAFDSVPHSWIVVSMKMHKVNGRLIKFIEASMKSWNTTLKINNHSVYETSIRRGIFQWDSMSPILFFLTLNPSAIYFKTDERYAYKDGIKISHLAYMDDVS